MAHIPNYFTCTLGQAARLNKNTTSCPPQSIYQFVQHKVKDHGSKPAVGFYISSESTCSTRILTFAEVDESVNRAAIILSSSCQDILSGNGTIGLLCASSPSFFFVWLALLRLGYSVLLLAPQLQPSAISHLCGQCNVHGLLFDERYADLASSASDANFEQKPDRRLLILSIDKIFEGDMWQMLARPIDQAKRTGLAPPVVHEDDLAFLFHTSGTSSGLPKPIPQSHRAAVAVLPRTLDESDAATFTTTPLYHGGIADLFRAWSGNAMIWLFPSHDQPITAQNIVRCLQTTTLAKQDGLSPTVKFFSSVPYVLQMMMENPAGSRQLQIMALVGVGGAALSKSVGDRLVEKGVRLVSRFGSTECGFLLSSHREDFDKDKDWDYLRNVPEESCLSFEEQADGTSELVVLTGWPHMAKTNRDNGSYATSDLFVPHLEIENAWKYHSRADSQLTLVTGKKFDPAPHESALIASPLLSDAMIFGDGKPFPGALLFRSEQARELSDEDLLSKVWPLVESLNVESQEHTRIPHSMLILLPFSAHTLEKSSKGTILRRRAEEVYSEVIDTAYKGLEGAGQGDEIPDDEVLEYLLTTIKDLKNNKASLNKDTDLFAYGLDSIASIQLRSRVRNLLPDEANEISLSIVEECGTAGLLAEYVVSKRHKKNTDLAASHANDSKLMGDMVERWGTFDLRTEVPTNGGDLAASNTESHGEVVILTGATGALGTHILHLYRTRPGVSKIFCLVRPSQKEEPRARVNKSLRARGLDLLGSDLAHHVPVEVLEYIPDQKRLGLDSETYRYLIHYTSVILHVAWTVNFRMNLRSFEQSNIAGLRYLLDLALASTRPNIPKFVYCSSTASCIGQVDMPTIPEDIIPSPESASKLGYSQSKWVAEQVCDRANKHTRLGGNIAILRVGQLSGDTKDGIWNATEAWPLMLSSLRATGCLPQLPSQRLDWLPVDIAAQCFVQSVEHISKTKRDGTAVLHVLNDSKEPLWSDLLTWLSSYQNFDIVDTDIWLSRLERVAQTNPNFPALMLLDHWKKAYSGQKEVQVEAGPIFDMTASREAMPALRNVKVIDSEYVGKIWEMLDERT